MSTRLNAAITPAGSPGYWFSAAAFFFQWIEGPADQIQRLIASLHGDPRHYDVVSLDWSEDNRERLYPNWEMEQVKADDIRAVLRDALESADDESNIAALGRILEHLDSGPLESLGRTDSLGDALVSGPAQEDN